MQSYREYFESEMRSLQDLAQEFAEAYPEQAAMLNLNSIKDRDPYVERLLEGMAFLTSQIRHRLDDSVPEISQALLEQVLPALIRPFPSHTVLEFTPSAYLKEPMNVDQGQPCRSFNSGPLKANCEFRTSLPVTVQPLKITHITSDEKMGGGSKTCITLQKNAQTSWSDVSFESLKLFMHGDWQLAYTLVHAFTEFGSRVHVNAPGRPEILFKTKPKFKVAHFGADEGLLPYSGRSRSAFNVVHDYFCAREKYLFVELTGVDCALFPDTTDQISITVDSPISLPVDTRLNLSNIRLHCIPAVNIYPDDAEPISVDHSQCDYRINPDRQIAEYSYIYSVDNVSSRDQNTGETYSYSPLHAMRHRRQEDRVYATKQRVSGLDSRITYLSLNSSPPFHPEVVSIEAQISNGQYPRRYVDIGDVKKLDSQLSRQVEVNNITRPTKSLSVPEYQDYQWQLVSLLSLNLSSMESIDNIKHLLSLFEWSGQQENSQKIEAIASVQTRTTHRLKRGVLFQGLEVRIELNESGYSNQSDMYLFGAMMHHFFSAFANMTEFVQTKVVQLPSYKEWTWNPVFGSKTLF